MRAIVYDCEILNCIPDKEGMDPTLRYCRGWDDHAGMGVTVVGAWDTERDIPYIFLNCENGMERLANLLHSADMIVGYNNIKFDNALLAATFPKFFDKAWLDAKSYDILAEIWKASGLDPTKFGRDHWGYSLDSVAEATLSERKTLASGAAAPRLWQRGYHTEVVNYCLNDVRLTHQLFELVECGEALMTSKGPRELLRPDIVFDSWASAQSVDPAPTTKSEPEQLELKF